MTSHSLEDLLDAVYSKLENQTDGLISADGHLVEDWEIRSARRVKVATDILSLLYRSHQDRHNAASPVNKLIPEILESIFLYLQPNKPFLDKSKHSDWNVHAWIRVTHVCRYWRATALAAKALWRRIVIHYRSRSAAILARAFFERSDPLPIELAHSYSPLQEEEVNSFYSLLNDNPHRIGALSLQGGQLHKKAWSLLQRPLPNLVELALGPRRSVPVTGQRQGNLVFLGGCTDSLRKLRLMGHSWYQVPFRALTHLYLHHDLRGGESRISADDLFRLLRSTSSTLEVLHMHTAPFFGVGHIYSRIQMPSLRYVEVHESVRNRTIFPLLFLQSTVCPRMETIVWDIEYMYTWARHEWNSNMLPPTDYLSGVTSLVVAQVSSHTKCCTLAGATLHIDQIPHVDTLMIAFLGKYLCNVTLLALPDFPLEPYHLMREVLRAYGSVTSLHLGWYEDLVEVLVDLEGHEGLDGESTSAICPNLKSLTIYTGANMKANVHKFREGLRALRLPRLRLSSSQSTRRKRRWRGKTYSTYTLQFCAGHPVLTKVTKYYFGHPSKQVRPTLVLLFSQATNGLGRDWPRKLAESRLRDLDTPLTRPDVLNDWNPSMPTKTAVFNPVFTANPNPHSAPSFRTTATTINPSPALSHTILPTQHRLAHIVEMLHTASLLHDDVIDESALRRGAPSAPAAFGNKLSVLGGNFVLGRASTALARLGDGEVSQLIASVLSNLVDGEILQMKKVKLGDGAHKAQTSREAWNGYLQKTYLKTASLMAKGARSAVVLGGCVEGEIYKEIAYAYGRNLGIAFQLVDDVLDYEYASSTLGKPGGADLNLGLTTAPALYAWEEHPEMGELIQRKFERPGDVELARDYVLRSSGVQRTRELAQAYADQAKDVLSSLPESEAKTRLQELAEKVVARKS